MRSVESACPGLWRLLEEVGPYKRSEREARWALPPTSSATTCRRRARRLRGRQEALQAPSGEPGERTLSPAPQATSAHGAPHFALSAPAKSPASFATHVLVSLPCDSESFCWPVCKQHGIQKRAHLMNPCFLKGYASDFPSQPLLRFDPPFPKLQCQMPERMPHGPALNEGFMESLCAARHLCGMSRHEACDREAREHHRVEPGAHLCSVESGPI